MRYILSICALTIMFVILFFILCAKASPDPPVVGDWKIEENEEVVKESENLTINGNLTIYGKLTLKNATLIFPPNSTIFVNKSGSLSIFNTNISYACIFIESDNIQMENISINKSFYSIIVINSSIEIKALTATENSYGIFIYNGSLKLKNSKIESSFIDFNLTNSSLFAEDTYIRKDRCVFNDYRSILKVNWSVEIYAIWSESESIENANISLEDKYGFAFSGLSDEFGIFRASTMDYEMNYEKIIVYNPYKIRCEKKGFNSTAIVSIDEKKIIKVKIFEYIFPKISIEKPMNNAFLNSTNVRVFGEVEDNESGIDEIKISFNSPIWTTIIENVRENKVEFEYNGELYEGAINVYLLAKDRAGNENITSLFITIDKTKPMLSIDFPIKNSKFNFSNIIIEGYVEEKAKLKINGKDVDESGSFNYLYVLKEGENIIIVEAWDLANNYALVTVICYLDTIQPFLTIENNETTYTNSDFFVIRGKTEIDADISIEPTSSIDIVEQGNEKIFSATTRLKEGINIFVISVIDEAKNRNTSILKVFYDRLPPVIKIFEPMNNSLLNTTKTNIYGSVGELAILIFDSKEFIIDKSIFRLSINLSEGKNDFTLFFKDFAGNSVLFILTLFVDTSAPYINFTLPEKTDIDFLLLQGVTEPDADLYINDKSVFVNPTGFFNETIILRNGMNVVLVVAIDKAGNRVEIIKTVFKTKKEEEKNKYTVIQSFQLQYILLAIIFFIALLISYKFKFPSIPRKKKEEVVEKKVEKPEEIKKPEPIPTGPRCYACYAVISDKDKKAKCKVCNATYHQKCAEKLTKCTDCGRRM
ncbi:MAG: hypothetical protein AB1779_09065 [Candidatus Thermoplasmatota archaeon]